MAKATHKRCGCRNDVHDSCPVCEGWSEEEMQRMDDERAHAEELDRQEEERGWCDECDAGPCHIAFERPPCDSGNVPLDIVPTPGDM